jgi:DNA mismatch repair protein MutL
VIRVLPEHVAMKIAAGEVIERPASVVKELVENSLDAGATRIKIEIEEGGRRLVRVHDDGGGMGAADLELAFLPHATSKIGSVDDLFRIASFGFRGEALASIGAVARAQITTRQRGEALGRRIVCEGGVLGTALDAGAAEGTVFEVRDLFFNVPVRLQFLKSDRSEVAAVVDAVTKLALPHPEVGFTLTHGGREVLSAPPASSLLGRIVDLFGREARELLAISGERDGVRAGGFFGKPDAARPSATCQYVFLNGRSIRDKGVAAAVARAYQDKILPRRYPIYFLTLAMDPARVDVNVHPTKTEVRFRDKDAVFGAVFAGVRAALDAAAVGVSWLPRRDPPAGDLLAEDAREGSAAGAPDPRVAAPSAPRPERPTFTEELRRSERALYGELPVVPPASERARVRSGACTHVARPAVVGPAAPERFLQIHDSYILVEEVGGFSIVDQHALHERMLFEKLLARVGSAESQPLLVPHVLELGSLDRERVRAALPDLAALGLVVAEFGRTSFAIHEVPLDLAKGDPARLIDAVLALDEERAATGFTDIRRAMAAGLACRGAVKFNQRLPDPEIRALLEWSRAHPQCTACAHGRPIRLSTSLAELELRFLRKA